jgi:hypothetical protein
MGVYKMIDFEITKKQKILEINNNMTHNYYFLIHGRLYNEDKTKYKKFKYIEWFDVFDLQEYFEKDYITKENIKIYVNNLIDNMGVSYIQDIKNYNDTKNIKEFYKYCNETIINFNNIYSK